MEPKFQKQDFVMAAACVIEFSLNRSTETHTFTKHPKGFQHGLNNIVKSGWFSSKIITAWDEPNATDAINAMSEYLTALKPLDIIKTDRGDVILWKDVRQDSLKVKTVPVRIPVNHNILSLYRADIM